MAEKSTPPPMTGNRSAAPSQEGEPKKPRLGEMLLADGLITEAQLRAALNTQNTDANYLGIILMRKKWVEERQVYEHLSEQRGVELLDMRELDIPSDVLETIPREVALEYSIIPIFYRDGELAVAMENPFDEERLSQLKSLLPGKIRPQLATRADLHYAINRHYNNLIRANPTIRDFYDGFAYLVETKPFDANRLIDLLIALAYLLEASDVHLWLSENKSVQLSLRIDGTLHRIPIPSRRMGSDMVSRLRNALKLRSGMDQARNGVAMDGRIEVAFDQHQLIARTAMIPLPDGEKFALKLIGQLPQRSFDQLGLSVYHRHAVDVALERPNGLVVITGADGSGCTTTLYALLNHLPPSDRLIVTVEDPIEARIDGLTQIQVDSERQFGFSQALKASIKQDADILAVGRLDDPEAARIAVDYAMTNRLVFAAMRMKRAVGALLYLLRLGVEPLILASSLRFIIAQQLVPKICSKCRQMHPDSEALALKYELPENSKLYRGVGCAECYYTGNNGRIALFETISVNDALRDILATSPSLTIINQFIQEQGEQTFREDALAKCHQGLISPEITMRYL